MWLVGPSLRPLEPGMANSRHRSWQGVRTRRVLASPDPDAPPRRIDMPAVWDDEAADALAAIVPGRLPVDLRDAAEVWLGRLPANLAGELRAALLTRRAAPDAGIWSGGADAYVLNLAAFDEAGFGLDAAALRRIAARAVEALRVLDQAAPPVVRLTDLDGLLAASGLTYGSAEARAFAAGVVAMVREAVGDAWLIGTPGLVDALLGAEAGGIAPRFDWLDPAGHVSRGAMAFLAARGVSAEGALAAMLGGGVALPHADAAAHAAMRTTLGPFMTLQEVAAPAVPTARREPPARPGGYARRVTLGGHKVFVRTAEFADGAVAEISLGLPKEGAAVRALSDSLSQIATLALQHGTPLAEIVEILAGTRFGPAGMVDGDPTVDRASSPLDYFARSLAAAYLPDMRLDPAEEEEVAPTLPLDMPAQARPRLRVVR